MKCKLDGNCSEPVSEQVQDQRNNAGKAVKAVKGSQILVLGVAYKKDVSERRESPALDIPVPICPKILCSRWATTEFSDKFLLEEKGANVSYHDPHVPAFQHEGMEMVGVTDLLLALRLADCVVIATDHSTYDWKSIHADQDWLVEQGEQYYRCHCLAITVITTGSRGKAKRFNFREKFCKCDRIAGNMIEWISQRMNMPPDFDIIFAIDPLLTNNQSERSFCRSMIVKDFDKGFVGQVNTQTQNIQVNGPNRVSGDNG